MNKKKHFSIRMDEDFLKKFAVVAKYDGRTMSGQIIHLMQVNIREFEKEHGKIELE